MTFIQYMASNPILVIVLVIIAGSTAVLIVNSITDLIKHWIDRKG